MVDRPLLIFPKPDHISRSKPRGGFSQYHLPSFERQCNRLEPIFRQLQESFDHRNAELQQSTTGIEPEQVLVMEIIGTIEAFVNAVKKIEGFEWLCEFEVEDILPDDDFYFEENKDKNLKGRLFLVMTNQEALKQMLSLWEKYQADSNYKFQWGLGRFKQLFKLLKNIRRWSVKDRLENTGILESWKEDYENFSTDFINCEVELWYRGSLEKREESQSQLTSIVNSLGGNIVSFCDIKEIAYHGVLVEIPRGEVDNILSRSETRLVKCDNVMLFHPVGQISPGEKIIERDPDKIDPLNLPKPLGDPVLAVLDGLPLTNHILLKDRIIGDDPDDWEPIYEATNRNHGTAMVSIAIYGDLNSRTIDCIKSPVYVRPIMKPSDKDLNSKKEETVPENVLIVDLVHRTVKRIFEGDGNSSAVAPTVKVINLSIGDKFRQFVQIMSPLARLLDWLSEKYSVLFVISAGNHNGQINLDVSSYEFNNLDPKTRENLIIKALYNDIRNRRLLAPAESINGITVGSLNHDELEPEIIGDQLNPYTTVLPSPISPFGKGYRRSIKPDIVLPGGRLIYNKSYLTSNRTIINPVVAHRSSGIKAAYPGLEIGDATALLYGTSNAAALASRAAVRCYETLMDMLVDHGNTIDAIFITPLIKAMLVHGCTWEEMGDRIRSILNSDITNKKMNSLIRRWLGYGYPDVNQVMKCSKQRATLIGFGELMDEAHLYKLPLPPSLISNTDWRRLTVTLAWFSPIAANTQKYRTASLWFEAGTRLNEGNKLVPERDRPDWQAVKRGTLQHEIFEGQIAVPFSENDTLDIKVNCKNDAAKIESPVPYGLVVSLQVAEEVGIALYDEIKNKIVQAVKIPQSL